MIAEGDRAEIQLDGTIQSGHPAHAQAGRTAQTSTRCRHMRSMCCMTWELRVKNGHHTAFNVLRLEVAACKRLFVEFDSSFEFRAF